MEAERRYSMKRLMKTVLILLSLSLFIVIFASCANVANEPADTTASNKLGDVLVGNNGSNYEESFDTPESYVIKVEDGKLNVTLTRADNVQVFSPMLTEQQELSLLLSGLLGKTPESSTDYAATEDPEKFEIIVGPSDHPETQSLMDECSYGEIGRAHV